MAYFSDKRMELEKLKSNTIGKLEILDEIENDFKRIIEKVHLWGKKISYGFLSSLFLS